MCMKMKRNSVVFINIILILIISVCIFWIAKFFLLLNYYEKYNGVRVQSFCNISSNILEQDNKYLAQGIMDCYIGETNFEVYLYDESPYNIYRTDIPYNLSTDSSIPQKKYQRSFDIEHNSYGEYIKCKTDPSDYTNMEIPCFVERCRIGAKKEITTSDIILYLLCLICPGIIIYFRIIMYYK